MLGLIISAIVVGLIVGALGRLVLPGRQDMPIWLTIVIGIVAALIGSLIASALGVGGGARIAVAARDDRRERTRQRLAMVRPALMEHSGPLHHRCSTPCPPPRPWPLFG